MAVWVAHPGMRETRTLAEVGWNELERGGLEHKMITVGEEKLLAVYFHFPLSFLPG